MTTETQPEKAASAITVDGLTKHFGTFVAVEKLTFDVPKGGVTGFVGPNGAGKSTTIRMLLGLIRATSGTGEISGHSITQPSTFLSRVGALIEAPALYKGLSGADNLKVFTKLRGLGADRIPEVLEIVDLSDRRNDKVANYSLGMKQRLAIAISLLGDPDLLVLDEPTNGLDPAGIIEVRELLRELGRSGKTVFVSSHLLSEVERLAENVVLVNDGKLVFSGLLVELLSHADQTIRVRTERHEDLTVLCELLKGEGWAVENERDAVVIDGSDRSSADVDRLAHEHGIVLCELRMETETLEEIFIKLTSKRQSKEAAI